MRDSSTLTAHRTDVRDNVVLTIKDEQPRAECGRDSELVCMCNAWYPKRVHVHVHAACACACACACRMCMPHVGACACSMQVLVWRGRPFKPVHSHTQVLSNVQRVCCVSARSLARRRGLARRTLVARA